jgi:hypothetical protein
VPDKTPQKGNQLVIDQVAHDTKKTKAASPKAGTGKKPITTTTTTTTTTTNTPSNYFVLDNASLDIDTTYSFGGPDETNKPKPPPSATTPSKNKPAAPTSPSLNANPPSALQAELNILESFRFNTSPSKEQGIVLVLSYPNLRIM